jgi:hypothetical protein
MENVQIFCGRLEYFMAIWYIYGHLLPACFPILAFCTKYVNPGLISACRHGSLWVVRSNPARNTFVASALISHFNTHSHFVRNSTAIFP